MPFESDSVCPDCGSNQIRLFVRLSTDQGHASLVQRCWLCDRVLLGGERLSKYEVGSGHRFTGASA